jgi:hypothetical protein
MSRGILATDIVTRLKYGSKATLATHNSAAMVCRVKGSENGRLNSRETGMTGEHMKSPETWETEYQSLL